MALLVTSETAIVLYKVTDYYNPGDEYGIMWNDADLGVDWPLTEAILSDKDEEFPQLKDVPEALLPKMTTCLRPDGGISGDQGRGSYPARDFWRPERVVRSILEIGIPYYENRLNRQEWAAGK